MEVMIILEVSQFIETENLNKTPFEGQEEGSYCKYKVVKEEDNPSIGNIWLTPDPKGMCEIYKYNYDTSG